MFHFLLKAYPMKNIAVLAMTVLLLSACSQQNETEETAGDAAQEMSSSTEQANTADRDISTETLVKIDPAIQEYADEVEREKRAFEKQPDEESRAELVNAYVEFADYMTYESPVSPREGKYHRALIEYRHALELDPGNSKVIAEIQQIEDIYRSMNRPIPGEE